MADREKVIKEFEEAIDILAKAEEPIFWMDFVRCACVNALELLKEQKAQKFFVDESGKITPLPVVVRCKDCKHYRYYGLSNETVSECTIDHCENPDENWFCADGERAEN